MRVYRHWLMLSIVFGAMGLTACANPVAETYQKGTEGGEKVIEKARNLQESVNQTTTTLEQDANRAAKSPSSP